MLYKHCLQLLENTPVAGRAALRAGFDALAQQDFALARTHFAACDTLNPGRPEAPYGLALTYVKQGMYLTALDYFIDALCREPLLFACQRDFVASLKELETIFHPLLTQKLRQVLLTCFQTRGLNHQLLLPLTLALIRQEPACRQAAGRQPAGSCDDPLTHLLLTKCYLTDLEAERTFTQCRRRLLVQGDAANAPLIEALAAQGRNNGYIWQVSATEKRHLRTLRRRADATAKKLLGMYQDTTPGCQPDPASITTAPVHDPVSLKVQRQYDSFPYPAWTDLLLPVPETPGQHPPGDILVAGCGTGRHALTLAARFPRIAVDAEDLSLKSLQLAAQKARTYGITNIRFVQADILEPSATNKRYPWIECIGTLHHTRSPLQALENLRRRLSPGGRMKLGLYSRRARAFIQNVKLTHLDNSRPVRSLARLRAERQRLIACPAHKDLDRLFGLNEFYYASGVKDLLFHENEKAFTLEELGQMLDRLSLSFLGFDLSPRMAEAFRQTYPDSAGNDLAEWATFEHTHPDCFLEMYQFWCEDNKNQQP